MRVRVALSVSIAILLCACQPQSTEREETADPLPSWNEGSTKSSIVDFVVAVTRDDSADFVPAEERIAVFDNDGTLWAEHPNYFQVYFIFSLVQSALEHDPTLADEEPFKTFVAEGPSALGREGIFELAGRVQTGMGNTAFKKLAADWLATAKHPTSGKAFTDMVYQPMLELLDYLRANNFSVYIVSGGGQDFLRSFAESVYGIPPENIVGSTGALKYESRDSGLLLMRMPTLAHINDGPGKPVGIERAIGRRPIFAFGNSDGDLEMALWTAAGEGRRFVGFVWHTDAERAWAYDRESSIGTSTKRWMPRRQTAGHWRV